MGVGGKFKNADLLNNITGNCWVISIGKINKHKKSFLLADDKYETEAEEMSWKKDSLIWLEPYVVWPT